MSESLILQQTTIIHRRLAKNHMLASWESTLYHQHIKWKLMENRRTTTDDGRTTTDDGRTMTTDNDDGRRTTALLYVSFYDFHKNMLFHKQHDFVYFRFRKAPAVEMLLPRLWLFTYFWNNENHQTYTHCSNVWPLAFYFSFFFSWKS